MRPAVFLDRDDTLIHCSDITPDGDLGDPALVKLLPTVHDAIRKLHAAGFPLIVVSNQGGVARGRYTTTEVDRVNRRVNELLDDLIARFYYCPWHPGGTVPEFTREHPWRKPQPGMLRQAAEDLEIDLSRSWMIGDADRDAEAGERAGCRAVLVARNFPPMNATKAPPTATGASYAGITTLRAPNMLAAAEIVLRESGPMTFGSPGSTESPTTRVTLTAKIGEPLNDEQTRRMVVATAEAIAERTGIPVSEIETTGDSVSVTIAGDRLAAIGFAAELRTLTTRWYRGKFGVGHLWGRRMRRAHRAGDHDRAACQTGLDS